MSSLIDNLYPRYIAEISGTTAEGGIVTVTAPRAAEATAAVKAALGRLPASAKFAALDAELFPNTEEFCRAFARAVASLYVEEASWAETPFTSWPKSVQARTATLGVVATTLLYRLTSQEVDTPSEAREIFMMAVDALMQLAAEGNTVGVAVWGAHTLAHPVDSAPNEIADLMWGLRGRMQHASQQPAVVFAGASEAVLLTTTDASAFLGWGYTIELRATSDLRRAINDTLIRSEIDGPTALRWADEIADRAQGAALVADQLISLSVNEGRTDTPPEIAVAKAWRNLARATDDAYRHLVREIRELDPAAISVIQALAAGLPPYGGASSPSRPNRALRRLQSAGLVTQPTKRQWDLTDPLFAHWLRRRAREAVQRLDTPTIWVVPSKRGTVLVLDGPSLDDVVDFAPDVKAATKLAERLRAQMGGAVVRIVDVDDPEDVPLWPADKPSPNL